MNKRPPKFPLRFFHWYCRPEYAEDIEGDLLERFQKRNKESKQAKWLLLLDVIKLLRPGIIKKFEGSLRLNSPGMFKHLFTISLRSFRKERSYTAINLIGLTISLSVSLMIWQYVKNQKACDHYHHNLENKYRINYSYLKNEALKVKSAHTTFAMGPEVMKSLPGIKDMVRIRPIFSDEGLTISNEKSTQKFLEFNVSYVEKSFLNFFNYPLEKGSPDEALANPNYVVLTKETAYKFFGNANPIGKILKISGGTLTGDFTVSGVLKSLPAGTHLHFDYLIPIDFLLSHYGLYTRSDGWQWQNFYTYFELQDNQELALLSSRIDTLIHQRIGHVLKQTNQSIQTSFQPLSNIYLDPIIEGDGGLYKGDTSTILIFTAIAFVILVIAGINYVNLASARALKRKSEVSLRKAIGANKYQLITQFVFEALLLNFLSIGVALLLSYFLMPSFGTLVGIKMTFSIINHWEFWIAVSAGLLIASLLIGLYPAFLSVRLGKVPSGNQLNVSVRGVLFRKSLMTFQLMITLILIAGAWLVYHQLAYMKTKELGVKMEQLYVVKGSRAIVKEGTEIAKAKLQCFKNRLTGHSDIYAVSSSSNVPGTGEIWYGGVRKLGDARDKEVETEAILVDKEFTDVYDFEFLAGEPFDERMADYDAVIINEKAMLAFGIKNPTGALNHSVILENLDTLKINGIIRDTHWNSLHEPIGPTVFGVVNMFNAFLSVKLSTSNLPETLELIEETYRELYPNDPYIGFFLEDEFNLQYEAEQQFGQIFGVFSVIAVIISCMGLFAMMAYSLSQKVKEIGIRKVLGATEKQLFKLLSKEYVHIFLLALVIATPIIYFGAVRWLENFAYRVTIGMKLFGIPALIVAIITLFIVSEKIFRAMKIDPAKQLRNE
ncbi:MAG: FtsX-like permease family protein [Bacteroidota bacterium]